jgi:hypothetical protein
MAADRWSYTKSFVSLRQQINGDNYNLRRTISGMGARRITEPSSKLLCGVGSDENLRVYGIDRLRVADGSIMPNVTTGNTMAPCVIIGERAADIIRKD